MDLDYVWGLGEGGDELTVDVGRDSSCGDVLDAIVNVEIVLGPWIHRMTLEDGRDGFSLINQGIVGYCVRSDFCLRITRCKPF